MSVEFKVGDIVEIVMVDGLNCKYYSVGDICKLLRQDCDGDWWAEFSGMGNESVYHSAGDSSAVWCIGNNGLNAGVEFKLVEDTQDGK